MKTTKTLACVAIVSLGILAAERSSAQPVNDDCSAASLAPLSVGTNPYDTTGAITDGTQTFCFLWNDAWFVFTPPVTGSYILATCGSTYDTIIQVFDGTLCPDDQNVSLACNDDACTLQSSVTVPLTAGVTCMVRLGSFDPAITGPATLEITSLAALPNDECVDALPAVLGQNPLDTNGASDSADPYDDLTCPGTSLGQMSNDLWFTFTPSSSTIRVSTCNLTGDTDVVIYQGGVCGALTQVGCNGDGPGCAGFSSIALAAVAPGVPCRIRIGSWSPGATQVGSFVLDEASPEVCDDGIDNDLDGDIDCADPADCGTLPACDESQNCSDGIDNDADGPADCADPDCAGIFPCPPAIPGDECLTALAATVGANPYDTLFALDSPEPFVCPAGSSPGAMAKDVWWTFTASASTLHRAETCSTAHDTDLAVYGGTCGALAPIDCSGDSCGLQSRVEWTAVAGTTYTIRLGSWARTSSGAGDLIVFESGPEQCADGLDNDLDGLTDCNDPVDCPFGIAPCLPPANDDCANPAPLVAGANPYDTTLATDSPEPDSGCPGVDPLGAMSRDIWWTWTAASTGAHRVENCGGTHDSDLEVYDAAGGPCDTGLPVGCSGNGCGLPSRVDWNAVAGVTYAIRLGSWAAGAGATGALTLIVAGPEDCADAIDNDLDGATDCADTDCTPLPLCLESLNCGDGVDNDLDGATDCQDGECACTAACPPPIPGDECCSPLPVAVGANPFDTVGFSSSSDAFSAATCTVPLSGSLANDIWLSFTASIDGDAYWDTCDPAGFDTDVVIYEGSDCLTKVQIACSGGAFGLPGCQLFSSAGQFPVSAGETYLIRIGSASPFIAGSGTFTLIESCAPPIANLAASGSCVTGDVTLTWNPSGFDAFEIARDGAVIATSIPAGATAYTDPGVDNGAHLYEVTGLCAGGGGATSEVAITVAAYTGQQDIIVRGELAGGQVDSVQALAAELTTLGRTFVIWDGGFGAYPCNTAPFEIVWQMNGTFPDHRCVDAADGLALAAAQSAGAGIYTECGDQWGFCAGGTAFDAIDGVAGAIDGDDFFTAMDGADSGLGLDVSDLLDIPYGQDQAGNDWTDQLAVAAADPGLAAAAAAWRRDGALGPTYVVGIHGVGTGASGSVISQSFELGGFGGDRGTLTARYIAALGGAGVLEPFRRGDCNGDGFLNIADAIFGLGALFPAGGGTPNDPSCDDSCDANDDGGVNIADMIAILGSLFPAGGGPPFAIPAPSGVCGTDPTSDAIGCAIHPPCP